MEQFILKEERVNIAGKRQTEDKMETESENQLWKSLRAGLTGFRENKTQKEEMRKQRGGKMRNNREPD